MISKIWHKFWFQERSPLPVSIFRIFFAFFILQRSLMEWLPNFVPFLGVRGLVDTSTLSIHWWQNSPIFNIFLFLPQSDLYRLIFFWLYILFVVCLMVGLWTRLSSIFVYLGVLTINNQCPLLLNGSDDFMRVMSFLLIFAPAGARCSVDSLIKPQLETTMFSPWAQRMMQVQTSLAYLGSFLCKISGYQWQQGVAAYYAGHLLQFQKFPLPWLTNHPPGYQILTYYTLVVEFSLATLVWYKPLRYWVLLAGLLMHIGIDWTMNLPYFEFLFVSSYLNFIAPADLERIGQKLRPWYLPVKNFVANVLQKVPAAPQLPQNLQFPFLFIAIIAILLAGNQLGWPLRQQYLADQNKYGYLMQLYKTQTEKQSIIESYADLPDNDERKLAAQEDLAQLWSLQNEYQKAGALLRHVCKYQLDKQLAYNTAGLKTLSVLGDIYLETGHLDAAEICYQTMLNYDLAHAPKSSLKTAVDLNNLAVIAYFRSLVNRDKPAQSLDIEKANNLYIRSLDKLHLSKSQANQAVLTLIDILANRYLTLRDSCHVKEAHDTGFQLAKLRGKFM